MPALARADASLCSGQLSQFVAPEIQRFTVKSGDTLKDLETVFKSAITGEEFELVIPKRTKLNLFPVERPYRLRFGGGEIEYYPYHLKKAETLEEKYVELTLDSLGDVLSTLQREQESRSTHWSGAYQNYRFSPSPTTSASGWLFASPDRLLEMIDQGHRIGRRPWVYKRQNGDLVVTNRHFLAHLKEQGIQELQLFRGHGGFDYHFYRLLLSSTAKAPGIRRRFAEWLRTEKYNLGVVRRSSYQRIEEIAQRVDDLTIPTESLLLEISRELTTAAMFTSPTKEFTERWTGNRSHGGSEILTLKLNLEKVPVWYLQQIIFGGDLDTEIVFPFATREQILALRASLTIEKSVARR